MLIGQEYNLHLLKKMFEEGVFPHSLLLSGRRGTGKKTLARELARALLCEKGTVFEECTCAACRLVGQDSHPDLRWYGLGEDLSSIKIDDIRDLIHWVSLKPYEGKAKVFILNQVELMTEEAANALLKTLEEPPPFTHIILLGESKHSLPETLVSRCFEVRVRPLAVKQLENLLSRGDACLPAGGASRTDTSSRRGVLQYVPTDVEARFLARHSKGSLGEARALKEAGVFGERQAIFEALSAGRIQELLESWVGKKRKELMFRLSLLRRLFQDALIWKKTEDTELLESAELAPQWFGITEELSESNLGSLVAATEQAQKAIETYVNPKIALFYLGLKLERCLRKRFI